MYYKELVHTIIEAKKSKICSQPGRDPGASRTLQSKSQEEPVFSSSLKTQKDPGRGSPGQAEEVPSNSAFLFHLDLQHTG